MAKRIDTLVPGSEVKLRFHGSKQFGNDPYTLDATFVRIDGEGDERRAIFDEVEAYRYDGRWAYGTSAEKLTIVT